MATYRRTAGRTGRSRLTLVLLVLTTLTVLTLDFRGSGFVDGLRSGASTVFSPVRDAASSVTDPIADAWNGVFAYGDLERENEELRERIAELEGDAVRNADAAQQLEAIAELDDLELSSAIPAVTARVRAGPLSNFEFTVEIDKGSEDGIRVGMPVVTGAGLVGRISEVTGSRSVVQLAVDPAFDVGVRHIASGDIAIGHGNGVGRPLVVDQGIELTTEIAAGDALTTAGTNRSIFPPDLPVGRVTSVERSADQLTQVLEVELLADLDNLVYVRVLLWEGTS